MGIFYPHFSKPKQRFIEQMIFGLLAGKDVKLSTLSRKLDEPVQLKKTEARLSRHLNAPGMDQAINKEIASSASRKIHKDTLIILDPSDIRKNYAEAMPFLGRVRDGSTGQIVNGYWSCLAVACEVGKRRMLPLHHRLWSAEAPDFISENHQLREIINMISRAVSRRGIYVIDRGGDRCKIYNHLLRNHWRFIIRLTGSRHLRYRGKNSRALDLAESCPMLYRDQLVKETREGEKTYQIEYGFRRVRMPGKKPWLYLIVVKGFGRKPMMLLTTEEVTKSRKSIWFIVEGYISRWLVEDALRFIKQSYKLEDVRVLSYQRLQNMMALVLAAIYFSAVWLGSSVKLAVLSAYAIKASKRFFGIAEFHYYALADGIAALLSRIGASRSPHPRSPPVSSFPQTWFPGFG
ncbi:transposase [Kiritimatiella glycovorans]|uniref:Transposase DDE domain protein n=1 Tax=Kiritimatiella glycovorans TaxID=1307763 RepID=A0A0G3EAW8_9BACT|nr:transposase [Kiritimatiella glycovorans]AKJ63636.1 Transposase DDE domain protein [Kiritimatiella glycovorans]